MTWPPPQPGTHESDLMLKGVILGPCLDPVDHKRGCTRESEVAAHWSLAMQRAAEARLVSGSAFIENEASQP